MKEHVQSTETSNPINPGLPFFRYLAYYPSRYATFEAALLDISNLDVVMYLHGAGAQVVPGDFKDPINNRYNDICKSLYDETIDETTHPILDRCIFFAPRLLNDTAQFQGNNRIRIKDCLDVTFGGAARYHVTGLSRGGQGGYVFVAVYPDFFTTWGCLAGNDWRADDDLRALGHETGFQPISPIPNTSITQIRHWHGSNDTSSNTYTGGQQTIQRLIDQEYTNECTLVTYTGRGHDIWPDVYVLDNYYLTWLESYIPAIDDTAPNGVYPGVDPHPEGALAEEDESITKTVLWQSSDMPTYNRVSLYHNWMHVYKNAIYMCYMTAGNRPKIVKVPTSGSPTEVYLEPDDYTVLDDRHNGFSIGVDRLGYIHIMGDMHGHRPLSDSPPNVDRYFRSHVMYWRSNAPESIEDGFTFMGWEDPPLRPDGHNWTYQKFFTDMNGKLFLYARTSTRERGTFSSTQWEGDACLSLYSYQEGYGWTTHGALNPPVHGNTPIYKSIFWEDNGEWYQNTSVDPENASYQGFYNGLRVDRNNVIHFAFPINNVTTNRDMTDVVYWKSEDGGNTFKKADGTIISAPVRAEAGANQGNIIHNGRVLGQVFTNVGWDGKPLVTYMKYADDSQDAGAAAESTPRIHRWNGANFSEDVGVMPFTGYAANIAQGPDLILTLVRGDSSPEFARIHRTRRFGEVGYEYYTGGVAQAFDFTHFTKTGELYMIIKTATEQQLIKLTFGTESLYMLPPQLRAASKKVMMF